MGIEKFFGGSKTEKTKSPEEMAEEIDRLDEEELRRSLAKKLEGYEGGQGPADFSSSEEDELSLVEKGQEASGYKAEREVAKESYRTRPETSGEGAPFTVEDDLNRAA